MRMCDVLPDKFITAQAVAYCKMASGYNCDWKALKFAMIVAATETADALGTPLEPSHINEDGSWATAK